MAELRPPVRILISSSPKTGNTWLLNLLAFLYDLPIAALLSPFDRKQADSMGGRWVAFHHMRPEAEILDWIEAEGIIVLTTVRHPGDILISLYHHQHAFEHSTESQQIMRDMLHVPLERRLIEPPAVRTFAGELWISIQWLRHGSRRVRYEDLWRDPAATLGKLATVLGPLSPRRIEQAVEKCDIELMRGLAGKHGGFFRSGQVGDWRYRLSPEIVSDLGKDPYRAQLAELGYTLDPSDPLIAQPAKPRPCLNPFRSSPVFDNGVAAAPIVADCYLAQDHESSGAWRDTARTGPGSYFEWLNAACPVEAEATDRTCALIVDLHLAGSPESERGRTNDSFLRWLNDPAKLEGTEVYSAVHVSNLAYHIYRNRPDLMQAFPDLSGPNRANYAEWFVRNGEREFGLNKAFLDPVRRSLINWGIARNPLDNMTVPWWPKLTNYALHLYTSRPDVQGVYPNVLHADRWNFLQWTMDNAAELNLYPPLTEPIRNDLQRLRLIRAVGRVVPRWGARN